VRELTFAMAIQEAMAIAMEADERVFLMGEDIGVYGGAFQVTGDLVHRFGEERVMDTPISELGGAGVAVGAALTGMRPVFELQFSDFSTLAMEQIVNQAAKLRYMLGGSVSVPLVVRMPLLAAIADPDPVIVFEHKLLYKVKGPVPEGYYTVPLDKAEIRRAGRDVTIVACGVMAVKALEAAAALAQDGIEAEVIDLRSLRPIDTKTIVASVKKTSRLICVYEGVKTLGVGAEVSAAVAESEAFDYLDAPILRLGGADSPIPYSPTLEKAAVPQVPDILEAARGLVRGRV
jgi:pyruvate dehydrogenase E1 component beta subunit